MLERCNVCDVILSSLGEDGCDQCGLTHDPLAPAAGQPLDFNDLNIDPFEYSPDLESELTEALGDSLSVDEEDVN